jgi:hypothetical protein
MLQCTIIPPLHFTPLHEFCFHNQLYKNKRSKVKLCSLSQACIVFYNPWKFMGESIIKLVLVLTQFSSPLFLQFPHLQDLATTLKTKNVKSQKKRYPPLNININEMGCSCRAWDWELIVLWRGPNQCCASTWFLIYPWVRIYIYIFNLFTHWGRVY